MHRNLENHAQTVADVLDDVLGFSELTDDEREAIIGMRDQALTVCTCAVSRSDCSIHKSEKSND